MFKFDPQAEGGSWFKWWLASSSLEQIKEPEGAEPLRSTEMTSVSAYCGLVFHALLVLQVAQGIDAREMAHRRRNNIGEYVHDLHPSSHMDHMDPSLNVFFTVNGLYAGKKMPIYFDEKDPSTTPHLLPREETDAIPFSSSKLKSLLEFFSFSEGSPQAKAMKDTLGQCEFEPIKGEIKFCATSLESMLDSARDILGLETQLRVLTTTITRQSKSNTIRLQNYTVLKEPRQILVPKMVACHTMPYPYAVFYCHGQETENRLFMVSLGGENGDRVEAVAACHMDTSQWDPDHVAFRVLGMQPGSAPVCHFFPADNLVWIPSPSVI